MEEKVHMGRPWSLLEPNKLGEGSGGLKETPSFQMLLDSEVGEFYTGT